MTYFDFIDFDPFNGFSSNNTKKNLIISGQKLTESPMYIEAPGFSKQDISADIENGDILKIKGDSNKYGNRKFEQVIRIAENVDKKTIEVTVENGMITIEFKHKEKESMNIKVK